MTASYTRFFCVLFLCAVSFAGAYAGENPRDGSITGLSVSGLKRTRLSAAQRPLLKFIGLDAEGINYSDVWAAILNTGILEPVSVEILDTQAGKVLAVTVREKWSVFPVPIAAAGSGGWSFGAALYDANAFGYNDKLFLAGIYSSLRWLATAGYFHVSPGGREPGWNGMVLFSREERHDCDQRDEDLRRFDVDTLSVRLGLNVSLPDNPDLFSASPSVFFEEKRLRNSENALQGPDTSLRIFGFGSRLSLQQSSWDGYLLSQEEATLQFSCRIANRGFMFQIINFRGVWEKPLVPGFRVNVRKGLVFQPNVPILFEDSPSDAQVDILPHTFSAQHYAGASAGLEKYLVKIPAGTLSLDASYQVVYSRGSILGDSLDHGVAGKLSFYLSRLAIPALGLGVAYNVKEDYLQGSFSLGMSF